MGPCFRRDDEKYVLAPPTSPSALAVSGRAPNGRAMVYRSVAGDVSGWPVFDAAAPPLPGFAKPPAFVF